MEGEQANRVAFVILHYLVLRETQNCIESIRNFIRFRDYQIVVVDNGSMNGTGEKLAEMYADDERITVICLEKNIGFSAGNNVGYVYAREQLHSEFIIVMNNDTEMIQNDFVEKAITCYKKTGYYVLGPDIINPAGIHQSPMRNSVMSKKEVKIWYVKRYLFGKYLHIHKKLKLSGDSIIYKKYKQGLADKRENLLTDYRMENVELQGSCLIFSPLYVQKNRIAFEELTFIYGEEALLLLRCMKNNWKIIYDPVVKIRHMEEASTVAFTQNDVDKDIFYSDYQLKAIRVILGQMEH